MHRELGCKSTSSLTRLNTTAGLGGARFVGPALPGGWGGAPPASPRPGLAERAPGTLPLLGTGRFRWESSEPLRGPGRRFGEESGEWAPLPGRSPPPRGLGSPRRGSQAIVCCLFRVKNVFPVGMFPEGCRRQRVWVICRVAVVRGRRRL